MMPTPAPSGGWYRRVWRWHFFASLFCLPLILSLAVTGALNSVTGLLRAVEYQGTYVKATLAPEGAPEFVAYINETEYFQTPLALGSVASFGWDLDEAHLLTSE